MIGYSTSELFLFTRMKSLRAELAVNSMAELQAIGHCLSERDRQIGLNWIQHRIKTMYFINLHFFTPQQAVAWLDRRLENNIVQLDEHVSTEEGMEIVRHIENEPYEFYVYIPAELIWPVQAKI